MKQTLVLLILSCLALRASTQAYDGVWPVGYNEFPGAAGYGHALIRFQGDTTVVEPAALAFNFESTVAAVADSAGQLLFYTNGCAVANRHHQLMPNGGGLNPGEIGDRVCPGKGYIVPQGAMALPDPAHPHRFYLLCMRGADDPVRKLRLGPLAYSLIDMDQQNGLGDVLSKNNLLLDGDLGYFSALRHGNGRDWWIIVPEFGNKAWHTLLLSPAGIEEYPLQPTGLGGPECEKYMATAVAPKGDKVANWGDCAVTVWAFDRCTGLFGNVLQLQAPSHWVPGGGVAFSPNGRYLYATSQNVLFRADLEAADPKLDTMRFSYDPKHTSPYEVPGNTFHFLANGPDGRMYGNIPSRARYLHVLREPDGATTDDLDFEARGVVLPVQGVRTLPHVPNYRLSDWPDSPCDTLGIGVATQQPQSLGFECRIAPNPATGYTWVEITGGAAERVVVFDVTGRRMGEMARPPAGNIRLDLSGYSPGLYVVRIEGRYGQALQRMLVVY